MKIYDISMEIKPDMQVYNNNETKKPVFTVADNFNTSSHYETNLSFNLHTGTHVDAPLHMIENGDTLEFTPIEKLITKCKVIDLTYLEDRISGKDLLVKHILKDDFILFKTKNSLSEEFNLNFVFLEKSGAEYLKNIGIKGVGIDSLGIERSQIGHETHKILLGSGIPILEGLRLKDVPEGEYLLVAPPIKILNVEAGPARAILIEE
ncbi:MAG TPA: cyclase family protein [Clostridiaceae bacterium]